MRIDIGEVMTGDNLLYKAHNRRYAQRVTALAVNREKRRVMLVLPNGKTKTVSVDTLSRLPKAEVGK